MPNGFYGSTDDWERMEAPLRAIDDVVAAFAERHRATISRNSHSWPERSVRWGTGIERLIQIYLADETKLLFHVWLCASEDRPKGRFWKNRFLVKERSIQEIVASLNQLLEEGKKELDAWSSEDLVSAY